MQSHCMIIVQVSGDRKKFLVRRAIARTGACHEGSFPHGAAI
jgi:hypothetical protein